MGNKNDSKNDEALKGKKYRSKGIDSCPKCIEVMGGCACPGEFDFRGFPSCRAVTLALKRDCFCVRGKSYV